MQPTSIYCKIWLVWGGITNNRILFFCEKEIWLRCPSCNDNIDCSRSLDWKYLVNKSSFMCHSQCVCTLEQLHSAVLTEVFYQKRPNKGDIGTSCITTAKKCNILRTFWCYNLSNLIFCCDNIRWYSTTCVNSPFIYIIDKMCFFF